MKDTYHRCQKIQYNARIDSNINTAFHLSKYSYALSGNFARDRQAEAARLMMPAAWRKVLATHCQTRAKLAHSGIWVTFSKSRNAPFVSLLSLFLFPFFHDIHSFHQVDSLRIIRQICPPSNESPIWYVCPPLFAYIPGCVVRKDSDLVWRVSRAAVSHLATTNSFLDEDLSFYAVGRGDGLENSSSTRQTPHFRSLEWILRSGVLHGANC